MGIKMFSSDAYEKYDGNHGENLSGPNERINISQGSITFNDSSSAYFNERNFIVIKLCIQKYY